MKLKSPFIPLSAIALLGLPNVMAGPVMEEPFAAPIEEISLGGFDSARLPLTNPVYHDLAVPVTHIRPLFLYQSHPDRVRTILGDLPVGGDLQLYALQLEFAIGDRFSIIAKKDGYIDFNPDNTFSHDDGWANIAAGVKYAFLYNPESRLAMSGSLLFEAPTGNTGVWQGTGKGSATPMVSVLKLWDPCDLQLTGTSGFVLPFDTDANSTSFFASGGLSFGITEWLFPSVELNYFRVIDEGDGGQRFNNQVGGLVPSVATFEGGDLINLGASNADLNPNIVTLALGTRIRPTERLDFGFAWEFPLTTEEENLLKNRFTVDCVIRF